MANQLTQVTGKTQAHGENVRYRSSAVAEMGDCLVTMDMGEKCGDHLATVSRAQWCTSNQWKIISRSLLVTKYEGVLFVK